MAGQSTLAKKQEKTFFGQPLGLATLFQTELWERFSYYGMRAILLYYIYYSVAKGGLGIDIKTASSIMAIYGAVVYFTGVFGGYIADRLIGTHRAVFWGGILIMLGHISLAVPSGKATALFISMVFITLGTGLLKPNISTQVGSLYDMEDRRRDAGFSIYYLGINIGSFFSPLIVGLAPVHFSFHVGFSFAAVGMAIGLIVYSRQSKRLPAESFKPADPLKEGEKQQLIKHVLIAIGLLIVLAVVVQLTGKLTIENVISFLTIVILIVPVLYFALMLTSDKSSKQERSNVLTYIPLFIAGAIFWAIEEQGSVVLAAFADQRTAYPAWFSPSWFQTFNPLFIMIYTPISIWAWNKLGDRQPSSATKFAIGLLFAGASFLVMALPGMLYGTDQKVGPQWLILSWALVIAAEIFISPVGMSITSRLAPKAFAAQMMSMWMMTNAFGQAINAQVVKLFSPSTEVAYFSTIGIIAIIAGFILFTLLPKLKRLIGSNH